MRLLAASFLFIAALSVFASPVVKREPPQSVSVVLTDLTNTVVPLVNQLLYATPENATNAILTPIIHDIDTAVTGAISNLKQLIGQPAGVIMASVNGTTTLDVSEIASLLADIVTLIFKSANAALSVVETTIYSPIESLLAALGQGVFELLSIALSLVSELLTPLLALLTPVFSIITNLGLLTLLNALISSPLGGLL